jgi:6-phosphogluconolactonase (cycloisomerase 2 family)
VRGISDLREAQPAADGIVALSRDPATGLLGDVLAWADVPAVSGLALQTDGTVIHALTEYADGAECRVTSLRLSASGAMTPIGSQPTGGTGACHVSVTPAGAHVLVAHFGSGSISVLPTLPQGGVGAPTQVLEREGRGPHPRQDGPHAHMIVPSSDGRWVIGVYLGTDELVTFAPDGRTGQLVEHASARVQAGAGPRQLVFHPSGCVFVANELDSSVAITSFDESDGSFQYHNRVSTLLDGGSDGQNRCGAIRLSPDNRFVYVGNRGQDTIAVFAVTTKGLRPVQAAPAGGRWARDLVVMHDRIYVANNRSNSVTTLERDPETGRIGRLLQTTPLSIPACLLAL